MADTQMCRPSSTPPRGGHPAGEGEPGTDRAGDDVGAGTTGEGEDGLAVGWAPEGVTRGAGVTALYRTPALRANAKRESYPVTSTRRRDQR